MIHVYTGNGKGKTTAALGLSCRAACAGKRVFFAQFLKGCGSSELCLNRKLQGFLSIEQLGAPGLIGPDGPSPEDVRLARTGFEKLREAVSSGSWDMVVADEICVAVHMGILPEVDVLELVRACPGTVELILTGRHATGAVIEAADLVTEMVEVKHYFAAERLAAREGIEF